jgi:hypothetical protein
MPETRGMPEPSRWRTEDWTHPTQNPWAVQAVAERGYLNFPGDLDEPAGAEEPYVETKPRRAGRAEGAARVAIADAMGLDIDDEELDDITLSDLPELVENPQEVWDALDSVLGPPRAPEAPKARPGESDGVYKVRIGNWRERHGLPRLLKHPPPCQVGRAGQVPRHCHGRADGRQEEAPQAGRYETRIGGQRR